MNSRNVKDIAVVALFVALISVCSFISVPFGAVPFTLQTLGVFCVSDLLGTKRGIAVVICYLGLGMCGLPLFNGFQGGAGVLLGATGGFLLSFLAVPLVVGAVIRKLGKNFKAMLFGNIIGMVINHLFGCLWYCLVFTENFTFKGLLSAVVVCTLPFIIPDIIKLSLAAFLSDRLKKFIA